jgi:hypothetical protein
MTALKRCLLAETGRENQLYLFTFAVEKTCLCNERVLGDINNKKIYLYIFK